MPSVRAPLTPRLSSGAWLGGGLLMVVIGVALAFRYQPLQKQITHQPQPAPTKSPVGAGCALANPNPRPTVTAALAEPDEHLRQLQLCNALRDWASFELDATVNWVLQRPLGERSADIGAVLEAASADPAVTLNLTNYLVKQDPALAHDHGCSLVYALAQRGDFSDALTFSLQGAANHREAWLTTTFAVWTEHQPQIAAGAALALTNQQDRDTATHAVMDRWATLDPRSLANFALQLPEDSTRNYALSAALSEWVNRDLAKASAWLNQLEPNAEFDIGVAAVATRQPLMAHRPETAVNWAESVFDPTLRSQTLAAIVHEWAKADHTAAQRYVETSFAINAADRSLLRTILNPGLEQ